MCFVSVSMIPAAMIVITRGNAEMSSEFLPGVRCLLSMQHIQKRSG